MATIAHDRAEPDARGGDRLVVGVLSISCALLHVSAAVGHRRESTLYFALFLALAAFQLGWGLCLAAGSRPTTLLPIGIVVSVGVVVVWLWSRSVGVPFGPTPGTPEAIGLPDAVATFDELGVAATCAVMLRHGDALPERGFAAICVLTTVSLLAFVCLSHVG